MTFKRAEGDERPHSHLCDCDECNAWLTRRKGLVNAWKTKEALARIDAAVQAHKPVAVFGLFSGGHDSVTATNIAAMHSQFTAAVHINTGIGVERTRQYVRETASARGWTLIEKRAVQRYRDLVLKHGFPGPHAHRFMYVWLKERCLEAFEREQRVTTDAPLLYVSGARSDESFRRMGTTDELRKDGRRLWVAPIHDWSALDCAEFMERQGIPRNPVVDLIHMSGECLCGAYARRGELAELGLWPETRPAHDEIVALEAEVRAAGFPWGWEDAPPKWWLEGKRGQTFLLDYDSDAPQHLCWSCNKRTEAVAPAAKRAEQGEVL